MVKKTPTVDEDRPARPARAKRQKDIEAQPAPAEAEDVLPGDGEEAGELEPSVVVKPVVNAIRILRHLNEMGSPGRAISIARALSINASTCFNILRTLASEQLVQFDPLSKTYTPGIGLTTLVGNFLSERQRIAAVSPLMASLAAKFKVTTCLWRRVSDDRIILIRSIGSPTDVRIEMVEGQRLPMMMGATGRVLASQLDLPQKELRAMFRRLRWQRPLTFEQYWEQVEEASARGFATDDGFYSAGVKSIAVPITDSSGYVAFTLVAIMFRTQLDNDDIEALSSEMAALAQRFANILF
ncbi:IclR family transcriptional regulator [Sphingomonas sp. BAUL-RG-20F-R05-02]|uniref:IclR family transcriptional regulator n=1 Tax=Sphingomonas sp. BAUL-RG-20F-R05-02 TaxID=2914830 RepID=UPI001F5A72E6|nr:IclR family transcriptional regulator [Sphingomonas sp. BAUL-RG-20F-R05-02]